MSLWQLGFGGESNHCLLKDDPYRSGRRTRYKRERYPLADTTRTTVHTSCMGSLSTKNNKYNLPVVSSRQYAACTSENSRTLAMNVQLELLTRLA